MDFKINESCQFQDKIHFPIFCLVWNFKLHHHPWFTTNPLRRCFIQELDCVMSFEKPANYWESLTNIKFFQMIWLELIGTKANSWNGEFFANFQTNLRKIANCNNIFDMVNDAFSAAMVMTHAMLQTNMLGVK